MRPIWTWQYGAGASSGTKEIRIEGGQLIASDSGAQPSVQVFALAEAFGRSRMLFVDRPEILASVLRTLAGLLDEVALETPRDRKRHAFWRHLSSDGARPLQLSWSWQRLGGQPPQQVTIDVAAEVVLGPEPNRAWQLLDDALLHGPLDPGIPPLARTALVDRILEALIPGSGLGAGDAFPEIDRSRIPDRSWSWNHQDDGEEGVTIGGEAVVVGYQFRHDMGWTAYPVERVVTCAPDVYVSAPSEIWNPLMAQLRTAIVGQHSAG